MPDEPAPTDSRWLAYELHDGLLQWVISSRMQVESVMARWQRANAEETGDHQASEHGLHTLRLVHQSLGAAIEEGRQLIGFLEQTAQAGRYDLPSALARLSEELSAELAEHRQSLAIQGFAEPCWAEFQLPLGWNLMRIIQQSIRNAIRHAGPCAISVEGWCSQADLCQVRVTDTGQGFDVSAPVAANHFGLSSLKHRAQILGAELEITSRVGQGTQVRLSFSNAKAAA